MTHFQSVFIKNLRFLRSQRELSQIKLSELVNISPNYLNAVENGKNFPSLDVLQRIIDVLEVLPYQLFLEHPDNQSLKKNDESKLLQELIHLKQQFNSDIDKIAQKY
ncbi:MAG: helix-turn-helix domain-containing protein [Treponema sp.]|nr:helix-turn-helix domain-containing protein [Treponema sp.]